jgi:hypothetical protein
MTRPRRLSDPKWWACLVVAVAVLGLLWEAVTSLLGGDAFELQGAAAMAILGFVAVVGGEILSAMIARRGGG